MNNLYLDASAVKQYLPSAIQQRKNQEIPILSDSTIQLFRQIQPTLPKSETLLGSIKPLSSYVTDLKTIANSLKKGEKNETLHKVLSVLLLAVSV